MERDFNISFELSFSRMEIAGAWVGGDLLVQMRGGDKPHIGTVVLAVPRPSLLGNGLPGATSSVINLTGHKDEVLCRNLAEELCRIHGCTVVCTGGFHVDGITEAQIQEVTDAVGKMIKRVSSLGIKAGGFYEGKRFDDGSDCSCGYSSRGAEGI